MTAPHYAVLKLGTPASSYGSSARANAVGRLCPSRRHQCTGATLATLGQGIRAISVKDLFNSFAPGLYLSSSTFGNVPLVLHDFSTI